MPGLGVCGPTMYGVCLTIIVDVPGFHFLPLALNAGQGEGEECMYVFLCVPRVCLKGGLRRRKGQTQDLQARRVAQSD